MTPIVLFRSPESAVPVGFGILFCWTTGAVIGILWHAFRRWFEFSTFWLSWTQFIPCFQTGLAFVAYHLVSTIVGSVSWENPSARRFAMAFGLTLLAGQMNMLIHTLVGLGYENFKRDVNDADSTCGIRP
jgi:hypothetical protein